MSADPPSPRHLLDEYLPYGATDTHVHVFDRRNFEYVKDRSYTPLSAPPAALARRHADLGIQRAVLVQPSVYGLDNACLLDAIHRAGQARCRGIAVVDLERTSAADLDTLHTAGVRCIRLNFAVRGDDDARPLREPLARAAALIRRPGWCVQVHGAASLLPLLGELLPRFGVPLVLDHFAGLKAADGAPGSPALAALLDLLASGAVYVKLSAFYRASTQAPHHHDLRPLVEHLIETRPDRLLWGSDWPHTGGGGATRDPARIEPFREVDLAASLAALRAWCGDDAILRRILVDNPAALYGFEPTTTGDPR